jgi:putative transposase
MPVHANLIRGELSLRRVITEFLVHYHQERNHQGQENRLLFSVPVAKKRDSQSVIGCRERLGGLLKYYNRAA